MVGFLFLAGRGLERPVSGEGAAASFGLVLLVLTFRVRLPFSPFFLFGITLWYGGFFFTSPPDEAVLFPVWPFWTEALRSPRTC